MNFSSRFENIYQNKYQAYQVAKWLQRNLIKSSKLVKQLSQFIKEFENKINDEHQSTINKCPHCKIDFSLTNEDSTFECPRCGLVSPNIILMDYNKFTKSYFKPYKQSFDHNKHFANCINNVLGIIIPKKDILPQLKDYCTKNNISKKHILIEDLREILKELKLTQYYKFTSYFYKELTGNELPFISHDIINKAKWYFKQFL